MTLTGYNARNLSPKAEIPELIVDLLAAVGFLAEADRITNASKRQRQLVGDRPRFLRRFNKKGKSRLLCAARMGDVARVQYWLDNGADPAEHNQAATRWASWEGRADVVQLLLADARVDPSACENYSIRVACAKGHAAVVQLLLSDPRVDPSARDNEAVRAACAGGHASVLRILMADPRVDPSATSNTPIRLACTNGHASAVQLLLSDPRVDPTANSNEAICVATTKGHVAVVQLLLADPRVDPSACPNKDDGGLLWACLVLFVVLLAQGLPPEAIRMTGPGCECAAVAQLLCTERGRTRLFNTCVAVAGLLYFACTTGSPQIFVMKQWALWQRKGGQRS